MGEEWIKRSDRLNRASKIGTEPIIFVVVGKRKNLFLCPTQGRCLGASTFLSGSITGFP
jgi:hypothetical protein